MARSPDQDEEYRLLRQLAQNPAWAVYRSLVLSQVQSSEQAKAEALRWGVLDNTKATQRSPEVLQGYVDGLMYALSCLDQRVLFLRAQEAEVVAPY